MMNGDDSNDDVDSDENDDNGRQCGRGKTLWYPGTT